MQIRCNFPDISYLSETHKNTFQFLSECLYLVFIKEGTFYIGQFSITRITCPCVLYPLLYSKTGVYRGIHYFLIFALKHILWVLVRTTSMRRFQREPTIYVFSKNMKIVQKIQLKIVIFTAVKNRCILHGRVFAMSSKFISFPGSICLQICDIFVLRAGFLFWF